MSFQADTIAAISTPPGPGAIGILRLSGPGAAPGPEGVEMAAMVSVWRGMGGTLLSSCGGIFTFSCENRP